MKLIVLINAWGVACAATPSYQKLGNDAWAQAYEKAVGLVAQLTLEEKLSLTYGVNTTLNGCAGNIPPIPRVGFTGMCLHDGPNGVRATDLVNGYTGAVSIGASWNKQLARDRGRSMFAEFKKKGVHVALGPAVGPIGRIATGGRNADSFGVDPYLSGALGAETTLGGLETGVLTSVKHYIANEQETARWTSSSNIDDKTLHELYIWGFQDSVRAGTGNVMCSYNQVNGLYACGNNRTLNGILKSELGFPGFVVSDWGGQHALEDAIAGLDMAQPTPVAWDTDIIPGIANGSFPSSRLDDMALRIIASWYYAGQDHDYPTLGVGMPYSMLQPHTFVSAKDPAAKQILLDGATEGHVLVKNINDALPLQNPRVLSVFGYDGKAPDTFVPNGTPLGWTAGYTSWNQTEITTFVLALIGNLTNYANPVPGIAQFGSLFSAAGSGAAASFISSPFEAISQRTNDDGTTIFWDFESQSPGVPFSDACLVFINAAGSETFDRPSLDDDYSNILVANVADQCKNTIVIIHNAWIRLVDSFVDHPNVTAIVYAHLPGQEAGRSLVPLLYGDENFSGKLPYTVARRAIDYGALLNPMPVAQNEVITQVDFTEGVYIDYRAFEARNITPRYEFGFGLSYTTYEYSDISIQRLDSYASSDLPSGPIQPGGQVDLWDIIASVSFNVKNSGTVAGAEAAQLYIVRPDGTKWLRGFDKLPLAPGETKNTTFYLTRRDLSEWDVMVQQWRLIRGVVGIHVGASSIDLPLSAELRL